MSTVVKDLGAVSAYAYAVEKGYTGTEAEFAELMADYAEVGQRAEDAADSALESKTAAQTAATTATNKATEATTAATTATTKAGEASTSASTATSAKDTAVSASQTATTKATEATTAAATAVSAKDDAVAANTAAQSAKTAAQTAQTGAETAAASVEASAEQIATNAADISQLKSEIADKSDTVDMLKAFPTDIATGSVASFADGANVPVKSLIVNIDPVQSGSGDPSPDNVRPILGWSEVNVNACGVNVWDEEWEVGSYNSSMATVQKITSDTSHIMSKNPIPVLEGMTYYMNSAGKNVHLIVADDAGNVLWRTTSLNNVTFNIPSGGRFVYFNMALAYGTTYNHDISINYPSTDTDYHPYDGQSINIQLGQTVYGGTLDVVSGELTIDRKLIEINGNCTRWASPTGDWIGASTQSITDMQGGRLMNLICNMLPSLDGIVNGWNIYAVNKTLYITLQKAIVGDSIGPVNAWLASNPVQVIYPLATPVTVQLTPNEVTTLLGSNNVWADSGDSAVEYRADPTLYIGRLTEPDADMIADANITSGQYFMVGNSLYKATANIASGGAITPNVNCTRKSLSEALNELNV